MHLERSGAMDYEPDKARYVITEEKVFSTKQPFLWLYSLRTYSWPSSIGLVDFCIQKQTEPFGRFKTIKGTLKGNI